ncbi:hypothetical protein [Streptomyces acidicola]
MYQLGYPTVADSHTAGDPRLSDDLFSSEHANHAIAVLNAVNGS